MLSHRKIRLYLIGAIVLLAGLGTALLIYMMSEDVAGNDLVYQMHHTPQYQRELQIVGGQMNVFADEFSLWFEGLWQGRSLARTVAAMTVLVSLGLFLAAYHLPADPTPDS